MPVSHDALEAVARVTVPGTVNRMSHSYGMIDAVAREMHERFASLSADSAWRQTSWANLPEEVREENRAQVRGVAEHLRQLGLTVEPRTSDEDEVAALTGDEIERAAVLEHDRWVERRRSEGWSYGAERDDEARVHPGLVSWEDLSCELRQLDRVRVQASVDVAHRLGYAVRR